MTAMTDERKVLGARFRRWPQALAAVALGLMWLLPSGADAAILKRVHSGITALPTAVDCSKSFVVLPGESRYTGIVSTGATDEAEIFRAVLGTFASPCGVAPGTTTTTLSIERGSNGSTQCAGCNVYVSWQVVTMDGATVLARAAPQLLSGGSTLTVTPFPAMAADPTKAFLLMSRAAGSAVAGAEAEYQVRGDLANCTGTNPTTCNQVTFNRISTTTTANHQADIAYEVVRLDDGSTVQRGTTSAALNATQFTAQGLSAFDRSAAVPFFSASGGNSTTATYLDETSWTAEIPVNNGNPTETPGRLMFTRKSSNNNPVVWNWFVVSFYKCQNSRLCSMSAKDNGSGSVTVSWSPIYDVGPGLFGPSCVINTNTPHACDAIVVRDTAAITWYPRLTLSYTVGTQPAGGPASMRVVFNGTGQSFTD